MLPQFLYYFIASVLFIMGGRYVHMALIQLNNFYTYCDHLMRPIFNQAGVGHLVHQILLVILIPLILVTPIALIYRLVKGQKFPYLIQLTWGVWLILILSILLH